MSERTIRTRAAAWTAGLASLLLVGAAAPGLAQSPDASMAPMAGVTITKMAYISPEAATDHGWNQQGLVGAEAAATAAGVELIKADSSGYDDPAPILASLKEDGAQFIVAQASGYTTTAAQFAKDNNIPVIVFDQPAMTTPGLVADVATDSQQGGYLAGVLAAHLDQDRQAGHRRSPRTTPTGTSSPVASSLAPSRSTRTSSSCPGPDRPCRLRRRGGRQDRRPTTVIAGGADIIFGMGDGSSFGMLQAVETATPPAGADKVWFIDVIGDKTSIDTKDVLLSSVLWDFAGTYTQAVADIAAGTFGERGLHPERGQRRHLAAADRQHLGRGCGCHRRRQAGIADGTIAVPLTPDEAAVDALVADASSA